MKLKDQDEKTYDFGSFPQVLKEKWPTQVSLIDTRQEIAKVLMCFSNSIPKTAHYAFTFLIYTVAQWTSLGNANKVITPTNVGAYLGADQAA